MPSIEAILLVCFTADEACPLRELRPSPEFLPEGIHFRSKNLCRVPLGFRAFPQG